MGQHPEWTPQQGLGLTAAHETKVKVLHDVPDVGMQVNDSPATLTSNVLVIMGVRAMPNIPQKRAGMGPC